MRDVVICEPVRSPIGRFGGTLSSLTAADLGETVLRALLDRTGLAAEAVDDVVLGNCYPSSEAPAIGRVVALNAGLPVHVPGMQVDRRCGSGLQSVLQAGMQVATGMSELVVAGGVESMSNVVFYATDMRRGVKSPGVTLHDGLARGRVTAGGRDYPVPGGMLETAENLRRDYGIGRTEQDELSVTSHRRAVAAQQSGVFAEEIVPITVPSRRYRRRRDRTRLDERIRRDQHPFHRRPYDRPPRHRRPEGALPAEDGDRRDPRLVLHVRTRPRQNRQFGYMGVDTTEAFFDGFRTGADAVLGSEPGKGFTHMMDGIEVGRVNVAARACGIALRAFELAIAYAQQRHTFGKPIAEH